MGALTDCSLGQRASCPLYWDNGHLARCTNRARHAAWLFVYMIAILCFTLSVEAQPNQQWHPTQFAPKTTPVQQVRPIPAGSLRMSPSARQEIIQSASRQNVEKVRWQMQQKMGEVKDVARDLEKLSEDKLTGNGSLRQKMLESGIDRGEVDRALEELKAAVPAMREAGKAMNEALDKEGVAR